MKVFCLSLSLLSATCWLYLTPVVTGKIFQSGHCMISVSMKEIRASFTVIKATIQARDAVRTISILSYPSSLNNVTAADRCCIAYHLLQFYVDKVFRHCETEDSQINRKISSIANSFLSIKKQFRRCHEQNVCSCGEEAVEKYKQILTNYGQMNVTSAAMKSLGELDILLDWLEKVY